MTTRFRFRTLLGLTAAAAVVAACAESATAPKAAPGGGPSRYYRVDTIPCTDSVMAGYGNCSTGGFEYQCFEYDPATQTETVVSCDPQAGDKGLTIHDDTAAPPPPPPPPPPPSSPTTTQPRMLSAPSPSPSPADSVCAGYGNLGTGGISYECFEYDPECGTEYIVCPDTTFKRDTTLKSTTLP